MRKNFRNVRGRLNKVDNTVALRSGPAKFLENIFGFAFDDEREHVLMSRNQTTPLSMPDSEL